jgi:hypothetical protein
MINMTRTVLVATFLTAVALVSLHAAPSQTHTVDYVIGLLEAGVDQQTIVGQIHERGLTFRMAEGDLDRLREAGASPALVKAVTDASPKPEGAPGTKATEEWSRPHRMEHDRGAQPQGAQAPPAEAAPGAAKPDEERERGGSPPGDVEPPSDSEQYGQEPQTQEGPQGGEAEEYPHGGYPYYVPGEDWGYYDYYPYSYYYGAPYIYYPYYPYPWSFYYSFYYPFWFWGPHHNFFGGSGRGGRPVGPLGPHGSSGHSSGGSPRGSSGGHGSVHASPHGSHH